MTEGKTGAEFSTCRTYRYRLWRQWNDDLFPVVWVMLNPSTADENFDDPTIRKCVGFARQWGYGGIEVVNLFAYRSTDPKAMKKAHDPIGPDNDQAIFDAAHHRDVVCGWGREGGDRGRAVVKVLRETDAKIQALKINADESPMHPLYVPYMTPLVQYPRQIGRVA